MHQSDSSHPVPSLRESRLNLERMQGDETQGRSRKNSANVVFYKSQILNFRCVASSIGTAKTQILGTAQVFADADMILPV